jgi:hypothetical protein
VRGCNFFIVFVLISAFFCIMSKLGLNRGKMVANSAGGTVAQEPPDKRRKMDVDTGSAVTEGWDDDLDMILTQNMNQLDNLVASSCQLAGNNVNLSVDAAEQPEASLVAVNGGINKTLASSAVRSALPAQSKPNAGSSHAVSITGADGSNGRLVGRGSIHSRSADFGSNCSASSMQSGTSARSVASVEQSKGGMIPFSPSVCANSLVRVPVMGPVLPHEGSSVLASGSINSNKLLATRAGTTLQSVGVDVGCIKEECDYYKTQVILCKDLLLAVIK